MTNSYTNEEKREILMDILEDNDTILFTTESASGKLVTRPMSFQDLEFDGDIWLMTKKDTAKYDEILRNPNVNIGVFDKSYASISGVAEIVEDDKLKEKYWNDFYEKLFDTEYDDPDLVMIKVNAQTAEYWETSNFTKSVANFFKQVVGDEDVKDEKDVNESVKL